MNSDFNEALLIFLNSSDNKRNLRKTRMMPNVEDSPREIQRKINQALVSGQSDGMWSLAPSDTEVRNKLVAERLFVGQFTAASGGNFGSHAGIYAQTWFAYNEELQWMCLAIKAASKCLWSQAKRWGEAELLAEMTFSGMKIESSVQYVFVTVHVVCHCWHDSWIMTIHQSAVCSQFLALNAANTVHFCTCTLLSYTIHRSCSHCHCWMRLSSWWLPNLTSHVTSLSMSFGQTRTLGVYLSEL